MKRNIAMMMLVAVLLGFSGAAWAVDGSPSFPMDFGSNYSYEGALTSVSVNGPILAISVTHSGSPDVDETFLVDVAAGTVTDSEDHVLAKGSESFSSTMGQVYSILNTVKEGNPDDASKLQGAISYLESWD